MKRCQNGTRRNKKTGECEPTGAARSSTRRTNADVQVKPKRCPTGSRRNKKTGVCAAVEPEPIVPTPPMEPGREPFRFVEETTELMKILTPMSKNKVIRFREEMYNQDIHKVSKDGLTELMLAIIYGNETFVKDLLYLIMNESHPPLEYWNYRLDTNETILHIAISSMSVHTLEKLSTIPGIDYSAQDLDGCTPLLMLCKYIYQTMNVKKYAEKCKTYKKMLRILLADTSNKNFNLDAKDDDNMTAKQYFVQFATKEKFKLSDFPNESIRE